MVYRSDPDAFIARLSEKSDNKTSVSYGYYTFQTNNEIIKWILLGAGLIVTGVILGALIVYFSKK